MPHIWDPVAPTPRGLVRPVTVDPSGREGPTRGEAAGPHWRRTSQGWYVPAAVDGERPEQRVMEQSVRLPACGAVTGWAALRLHGGGFFDGLARDGSTKVPVPLAVGPRARVAADIAVTIDRSRLDATEVVVRSGISCTRVERALFDQMRQAEGDREAVVALEMATAAQLTSIRRMDDHVSTRTGWKGVEQARRAPRLASEYCRSPNESRMRLVWMLDARLPRPRVNQPVYTLDGRFLACVDLLDVDAGLVGEYDGAEHRRALRHAKDVAREERLRRVGLEVFHVTALDLLDPVLLVERMHAARARAGWLPADRRAWTIETSAGAEQPWTLDEVLEHRDWMATVHAEWDSSPPA